MEGGSEILHENCQPGHAYLVEFNGLQFQAKFTGYPDNNQYRPAFEIVSRADEIKVLRELD